ncbi:hypothetical protein [Spirosoma fluviale]|uniref:Uncharacterized protein n=1 Tax=Spirosoma fluviale TaxID=1597977 RepID=A0A286G265_9BACT|nr:hypothetical protein [Spirosoma fluviale]SOD89568.1 hypothetical protein SAMN06269250_3115 [Spirosoma fluviale]
MKQKPDESLDQWVRHTLSQLPDSPPPGSSFDPERLWGQLNPKLATAPARRKIGMAWWIAAACLAGVTLSGYWLTQRVDSRTDVAVHQPRQLKPDVPLLRPEPASSVASREAYFSKKERHPATSRSDTHRPDSPQAEATTPSTEPLALSVLPAELPLLTNELPGEEKQPDLNKRTATASTPKRRFNVVHANELRAEEETRPKLYPAENFVRIGTGERTESISDESRPALTLPLTHKPNQ